jgi:hypothetical protein
MWPLIHCTCERLFSFLENYETAANHYTLAWFGHCQTRVSALICLCLCLCKSDDDYACACKNYACKCADVCALLACNIWVTQFLVLVSCAEIVILHERKFALLLWRLIGTWLIQDEWMFKMASSSSIAPSHTSSTSWYVS